MAESTRPGAKTVRFDNVAIFPGENGEIKLSFRGPDGVAFISSVNNRPASMRCHPHLYGALASALVRNGIDPRGEAESS